MPDRLREFAVGLRGGRVTLQALVDAHGDCTRESLVVLLGVLCLFPLPGVGTVLGVGVVALAAVMRRQDVDVALPARVARVELSGEWAQRVLKALAGFHAAAARAFRPRLKGFVQAPKGRAVAGFVALMGVLIALPIPLGNTLPALALICLGLGQMRQDGAAMLLASFCAILAVLWAVAVAIAGWYLGIEGLQAIALG